MCTLHAGGGIRRGGTGAVVRLSRRRTGDVLLGAWRLILFCLFCLPILGMNREPSHRDKPHDQYRQRPPVRRDQKKTAYLVRFNPYSAGKEDRTLRSPLPDLYQRGRGQTVRGSQDRGRRRSQCGNAKSSCAEKNCRAVGNGKLAWRRDKQLRKPSRLT